MYNVTVFTRIIEPRFRTLESPLLVRPGASLLFFVSSWGLSGQLSQCFRPLSNQERGFWTS